MTPAADDEKAAIELEAAMLTQDERDVLTTPEDQILPTVLASVHWDLIQRGLVVHDVGYTTRRVHLTERGQAMRDALARGLADDAAPAWGIFHRITGAPPCWWRPNANGYSRDIALAGLYTREAALAKHGLERAGKGNGRDEAIPPAKMLALVADEVDAAMKRLDQLQDQHHAIRSAFGGKDDE